MEKLNLTEPAKIKVAATFDSEADHYDDAPLAYWDVIGRRTIDRLDLRRGFTVLDVGCGTGASALPAAERVGPSGRILGVDLADKLLDLARAKAAKRRLHNAEFRQGDMTALGFPDGNFDAVVSVLSVFFVSDMEDLVRELWRMVKPGGKLAITTWGPRNIDPKRTLTLTFESGSLVRARIARDAHHQLSAMLFDDLCKNEVEMLGGVKTIGATGEILLLLLCGIDVFHDAKAKLSQVDGQPARIET